MDFFNPQLSKAEGAVYEKLKRRKKANRHDRELLGPGQGKTKLKASTVLEGVGHFHRRKPRVLRSLSLTEVNHADSFNQLSQRVGRYLARNTFVGGRLRFSRDLEEGHPAVIYWSSINPCTI